MRIGFSLAGRVKRGTLAAGVCLALLGAGASTAAQAARMAPATPGNAGLASTSCVKPTWCMAVGSYRNSRDKNRGLTEIWNGKTWRLVSNPAATGLESVSCSGTSNCLAFGANSSAYLWNGRKWAKSTAPKGGQLWVSCGSRTMCVTGQERQESILTWNGKRWANTRLCRGGGSQHCVFNAACASASLCVAVGWGENDIHVNNASAYIWNGKRWSKSLLPDAEDPGTDSNLTGVTCAAQSCLAIGSVVYEYNNHAKTWKDVAPTNGVGVGGDAISCSSGTNCMTVDDLHGNPWFHNGAWTQTHFAPDGNSTHFVGLSCKSGTCLAVGFTIRTRRAIAELWNGTAWKVLTPKVPAS